MSNLDVHCDLKWLYYLYDVTQDRLRACCKSIQNRKLRSFEEDWSYLEFTRRQMMSGQRAEDCDMCWQLEKTGAKSFRIATTKIHGEVSSSPNSASRNAPETLELIIGKACDLQCVYCGPEASTKWQKALNQPMSKFEYTPEVRERLLKRFEPWWESLSFVNIIGGEPLIQDSFYRMMDDLLSHPKGKLKTYRVITNLNSQERQLDRFIKMIGDHPTNKFQVNISNEAVGSLAEEIRVGLNFERFEKNLDRLLKETPSNCQIFFLPTLSTLCLEDYDKFIEWLIEKMVAHSRDIYLVWNAVYYPRTLSPWTNPEKLLAAVKKCQPILEKVIQSQRAGPALKKNWAQYESQLLAAPSSGF